MTTTVEELIDSAILELREDRQRLGSIEDKLRPALTDQARLAALKRSAASLLERIDKAEQREATKRWSEIGRSKMRLEQKCQAISELGSRGYLELPE